MKDFLTTAHLRCAGKEVTTIQGGICTATTALDSGGIKVFEFTMSLPFSSTNYTAIATMDYFTLRGRRAYSNLTAYVRGKTTSALIIDVINRGDTTSDSSFGASWFACGV